MPKVILAGRCSKSSAVTGTVAVRAIARQRARVELGCADQMTWNKVSHKIPNSLPKLYQLVCSGFYSLVLVFAL